MTERSRGAPDPTESPSKDDAPSSADLSALYRTDALIEALSARAHPGSPLPLAPDVSPRPRGARSASDPALGLLGALISDVDEGLPEVPRARPRLHRVADTVSRHRADAVAADGVTAERSEPPLAASLPDEADRPYAADVSAAEATEAGSPVVPNAATGRAPLDGTSRQDGDGDVPEQQGSRPSRRGSRTIVALGVVGAVLATTGVAAAGGGLVGSPTAASAVRTSGKPSPSGQGKAGGGDASSTRSQVPAARPPAAPSGRGQKEKPRSGAPGTDASGRHDFADEEARLRKRLNELLKGRPPGRPQTHVDPVDETRRRLAELRRRNERRGDHRRHRPHRP
ncbi:hypothetical protein AB0J52_26030 [Spirillospora sp. NPDC049652]